MISFNGVGEELLARWKSDVDLGDIVFVHGQIISSRTGELSVMADDWSLASKALRPLPVAHKELNEETRVRQRYVDLIIAPGGPRDRAHPHQVMAELRAFLAERDFLEVETPMLQTCTAAPRPVPS